MSTVAEKRDAGLVLRAFTGRRLLTERGSGYQFLHLSIQEFLAASHLTNPESELKWIEVVDRKSWRRDWELILQFVAGTLGPLSDNRARGSPKDLESLVGCLLDRGFDDFHGRRAFVASACLSIAPRTGSWEKTWISLVEKSDRAFIERTHKSRSSVPASNAYLALLLWLNPWLGDYLSLRYADGERSLIEKLLQEIIQDQT